jgi:hypothetical protein
MFHVGFFSRSILFKRRGKNHAARHFRQHPATFVFNFMSLSVYGKGLSG